MSNYYIRITQSSYQHKYKRDGSNNTRLGSRATRGEQSTATDLVIMDICLIADPSLMDIYFSDDIQIDDTQADEKAVNLISESNETVDNVPCPIIIMKYILKYSEVFQVLLSSLSYLFFYHIQGCISIFTINICL